MRIEVDEDRLRAIFKNVISTGEVCNWKWEYLPCFKMGQNEYCTYYYGAEEECLDRLIDSLKEEEAGSASEATNDD